MKSQTKKAELFIPIKGTSYHNLNKKRAYILAVRDWIKCNKIKPKAYKIEKGDLALFITYTFREKTNYDIDNLLKSTIDALTGIFFKDDRQIKKLIAEIEENNFIQKEGAFIKIAKIIG